MTERRGAWLILAAAVLWGTTGTARSLGPDAASPPAVGVTRLLVAGPALALLALVRRTSVAVAPTERGPTVVAALAMAVYQPAFFTAVDRTGVALGTVVAIGSAPVLAGVLEWIIHRVRPSSRWMAATAVAVAGVAMLTVSGERVGADASGVGFALGAGLAYAVYVLSSARLVRSTSAVGAMAAVFLLAGLMSLPALALVDLAWVATAAGAGMVVHLGVVTTAVAYVLFGSGLRTTETSTAATLTLGEPVTAAVLGVAVLGERPGALAWIGVALVLIGLAVAVRTAPTPSR